MRSRPSYRLTHWSAYKCFVTRRNRLWRITRKNESACRERNPFVACSLERGEHRHGILQSNAEYGSYGRREADAAARLGAGIQSREISEWLDAQHVYYEVTSPVPGDNVPIQLNNKGFFAWFEPICKLYMLPKYNELDLTPFFAPFFMVFFGLCLGDSGYGLFLFLGATLYRLFAKNISAAMRPVLSLVQVLAASTFFCGLLTGTFFGANIYDIDLPFFQKMKAALFMDNNDMFQLSLILGVVQILFGMVLKAVNQGIQFGFKYAVATIGWIILLVPAE